MHQATPILSLLGLVAWGDLGGTTIYKSHRGKVVAFAKTFPFRPPTLYQAVARVKFAMANERWRNLGNEQKKTYVFYTKTCNLPMCGVAWFMGQILRMEGGAWHRVEFVTNTKIWPPLYKTPQEDEEPVNHWFDAIRYPKNKTQLLGSPTLSMQPRSWTIKHFAIVWDPKVPLGAPVTVRTLIRGLGTVNVNPWYNGRFNRWWFNSPPTDCTTHIRFTYTDADGNTASNFWSIRTCEKPPVH